MSHKNYGHVGRPSQTQHRPAQNPAPFRIDYGHNGEKVAMVFPMKVSNVMFTPQQVDEVCEALQLSKGKLLQHLKDEKAKNG